MRFGSAILLLLLPCCSITAFFGDNRYTCDAGRCVDGYVCHPETNLCVRPTTADALTTATGDACDVEGAFVPCGPGVSDCSLGCRTCGNDGAWGACSVPVSCEGVRLGDDCGACENKCLGLPEVQRSKCDIATGTAVCKVLRCKPGFVDGNLQAADGCEVQCVAAETACDGVDEDCNGVIDDLSDAATDAACITTNATAANVKHYACELGKCLVLACTPGFDNPNGLAEDGCEGTCTPSNGAVEACDGADNDCDGKTDPDDTPGCVIGYRDQDRDGVGDANASRCLCPGVASLEFTADNGLDCLDSNDKCTTVCDDVDMDGWCAPVDCNDLAPACTLECGPCNEVEEPEPNALTVVASAQAGTLCKTSTITVTPQGGTFGGKRLLIGCSVAVPQTIATYDFETSLAPFDDGNDRVDRVEGNGCFGQNGTSARLLATGGTNGLNGCGSFLGTPPAARAVMAAGKTAAPAAVGLNLQGWRELGVRGVFDTTIAGAMADSAVSCNGTSMTPLSAVSAGCASASTALPVSHNECSNLIITMLGDARGCIGTSHVLVDNIVVSGVPRIDPVVESEPGVYTTTVTSCIAGARIEDLRCTYDRSDLDDLFGDVDVQF